MDSIRRNRLGSLSATAIALLAVGLRVFALDRRSLSLDEIVMARCITPDFSDLLNCMQTGADLSPILYLLNYFWYRLAGSAILPMPDWFFRVPSVLLGLACIPVAWKLADELMGRRAAWVSAVIWAVIPLVVGTSQQLRPYAATGLFTLASTLFLVRALRRATFLPWVGFGISAALNIYSHYSALIVLVGQALFCLGWLLARAYSAFRVTGANRADEFRAMRRYFIGLILAVAVAFLVLAAWWSPITSFLLAFEKYRSIISFTPFSLDVLGRIPVWLIFGEIDFWDIHYFYPPAEWLVTLALLCLLGLIAMIRSERIALLLVICNIMATTVSFWLLRADGQIPVQPRYMTSLQMGYYLLLASGLSMLAKLVAKLFLRYSLPVNMRRISTWASLGIALAALLPGLIRYYTPPYDDWRGVANYLRDEAGVNDVALTIGRYTHISTPALSYYFPLSTMMILDVNNFSPVNVKRLQERKGRVWGVFLNIENDPLDDLVRWGGSDYTLINFGSLVVMAPSRTQSLENAAENSARLINDYDSLNPKSADFALTLLNPARYTGVNLLKNADFSSAGGSTLAWWEVYNTQAYVVNDKGLSVLVIPHTEKDSEALVVQRVDAKPDTTYLLRFEYKNTLSQGNQRVDFAFRKSNGEWTGASFFCSETQEWLPGIIRYTVTNAETMPQQVSIFLRNMGVGQVYFRKLNLIELEGSH